MRLAEIILQNRFSSHVPFALLIACIIGIYYSTFLTTIGTIGLCFYALLFIEKESLKTFLADTRMSPLMLIFILVLLSGWNSENITSWATAIRIKAPFLVLPLAFFLIPRTHLPQPWKLMCILIIVTSIVGIPVLIYSQVNQAEMLELISKGQPIPTPIEHVKYSMFNAFAANVAVFLLIKKWNESRLELRASLGAASILLISLLHVLAVRTGLVIFYTCFVFALVCLALIYGHKKSVLVTGSLLLILAFASYFFIPSIKEKIGYMRYDWIQYETNEGLNYSDSERIMTAIAGYDVWSSSKIIGVGYGDVKNEVVQKCRDLFKLDIDKLPHSQFLLTLAAAGIVGLILFLFGFYVPLIRSFCKSESGVLLALLYLNYSLSFLVENSLERSMSVSFFLVIALVLIKDLSGAKTPK